MHSCRAMRPLEVEGKDYFFVSKQKFEQRIAEKQLLEHALVYGEYKGIPRQQVGPGGSCTGSTRASPGSRWGPGAPPQGGFSTGPV